MSHLALNAVRKALSAPDCTLKPLPRLVLMILADHVGKDGTCWPSRKTIASLAGVSEASVKRAVGELIGMGCITRDMRCGETGAQSANLFKIVMGGAHPRAGGGSPVTPGGLTCEPGGGSNATSAYKEEPSLKSSREASVVAEAEILDAKINPAQLCERLMARANGALNPLAKGMGLLSVAEPIGWLNSGADLEKDILPAIADVSHRVAPGSVRSWNYFRGAVSDFKFRREQGLPPPSGSAVTGSSKPSHMRRYG